MSVKLSKAERATLILSISDYLKNYEITSDGAYYASDYEDAHNILDEIEEKNRISLTKILDDGGLRSFITYELSDFFISSDAALSDGEFQSILTVMPSFDFQGFASSLVDKITNLPSKYMIGVRASLPMSRELKGRLVDIRISDKMKLVSHEQLNGEFITKINPERKKNWVFNKRGKPNSVKIPSEDSLYFLYSDSGCISDRYDSKIIRRFSDDIRAFYGSLLVSDVLFDFGYDKDNSSPAFFVKKPEDSREVCYTESLDTDLVRATYLETSTKFDRSMRDGEELESYISAPIKLFKSANSSRLRTAAIWILRAYLSSRPMDQVLESTIALEVLLGDRETSDRIGLSKLMANRCAYSLGKNSTERDEIIKFFIEFYKVRSEVVHTGQFKLGKNDRKIVYEGLNLAARMLMHELNLS